MPIWPICDTQCQTHGQITIFLPLQQANLASAHIWLQYHWVDGAGGGRGGLGVGTDKLGVGKGDCELEKGDCK